MFETLLHRTFSQKKSTMLLIPITTILLLITVDYCESHVLKPIDRDTMGVNRNIDIPLIIDPLQQSRPESEDEQLRRTKSVFSVPIHRQASAGSSECPEGSQRVVEGGPCEQQAATIKSPGGTFLVDSLRKFYAPPSTTSHRPHHRRRRPSTTTTTRRYDLPADVPDDDDSDDGDRLANGQSPYNEVTTTEATDEDVTEFPVTDSTISLNTEISPTFESELEFTFTTELSNSTDSTAVEFDEQPASTMSALLGADIDRTTGTETVVVVTMDYAEAQLDVANETDTTDILAAFEDVSSDFGNLFGNISDKVKPEHLESQVNSPVKLLVNEELSTVSTSTTTSTKITPKLPVKFGLTESDEETPTSTTEISSISDHIHSSTVSSGTEIADILITSTELNPGVVSVVPPSSTSTASPIPSINSNLQQQQHYPIHQIVFPTSQLQLSKIPAFSQQSNTFPYQHYQFPQSQQMQIQPNNRHNFDIQKAEYRPLNLRNYNNNRDRIYQNDYFSLDYINMNDPRWNSRGRNY